MPPMFEAADQQQQKPCGQTGVHVGAVEHKAVRQSGSHTTARAVQGRRHRAVKMRLAANQTGKQSGRGRVPHR